MNDEEAVYRHMIKGLLLSQSVQAIDLPAKNSHTPPRQQWRGFNAYFLGDRENRWHIT